MAEQTTITSPEEAKAAAKPKQPRQRSASFSDRPSPRSAIKVSSLSRRSGPNRPVAIDHMEARAERRIPKTSAHFDQRRGLARARSRRMDAREDRE